MVTKPTLNTPKGDEVAVAKKKPIKKFASGQVSASIWENDIVLPDKTTKKTHSVTIVRSYKAKDSDEWEQTNVYNVNNLADLETVASECLRFLKLKE